MGGAPYKYFGLKLAVELTLIYSYQYCVVSRAYGIQIGIVKRAKAWAVHLTLDLD